MSAVLTANIYPNGVRVKEPVYIRAAGLLQADLGSELVALDPVGGACFGFNDVASSVWRSLEDPKTFEQIQDGLLAEFEVERQECIRELRALLKDLQARGLVEQIG